jgi:hypothetical protein
MYCRSHSSALTPIALAPKRKMSLALRCEKRGILCGRREPTPVATLSSTAATQRTRLLQSATLSALSAGTRMYSTPHEMS